MSKEKNGDIKQPAIDYKLILLKQKLEDQIGENEAP